MRRDARLGNEGFRPAGATYTKQRSCHGKRVRSAELTTDALFAERPSHTYGGFTLPFARIPEKVKDSAVRA